MITVTFASPTYQVSRHRVDGNVNSTAIASAVYYFCSCYGNIAERYE